MRKHENYTRKLLPVLLAICLTTSAFAQKAVIATTDFTTGDLSAIDAITHVATNEQLLIHGDAKVRAFGDRVYVINRLGQDNIIVLSKDDLASPITQYSTGNGTNPHETAVASDTKAYVTLYARDYLLIVNPATGDSLGSIDLSTFSDADGLPEASQMAQFGDHLYVAIQRLNRDTFFSPTDFSTIAVIDTQTDALVDVEPGTDGIQGIRLQTTQPFGHTQRAGRWVIASVGSFGAQDGGIEVVNLLTLKTEGIVLSESVLGGDVGPLSMLSDTVGYVVLTDANFVNSIKQFDLAAGTASDPLPDHSGGFTPAISVLGSTLYVLDRGSFSDPASAGVTIYASATNTMSAGPISTGIPPSDIAFIDVKTTDFDDDGEVAFSDFLLFAAAFGKQQDETGYASPFDLSPNGVVDFNDFLIFAEGFGK